MRLIAIALGTLLALVPLMAAEEPDVDQGQGFQLPDDRGWTGGPCPEVMMGPRCGVNGATWEYWCFSTDYGGTCNCIEVKCGTISSSGYMLASNPSCGPGWCASIAPTACPSGSPCGYREHNIGDLWACRVDCPFWPFECGEVELQVFDACWNSGGNDGPGSEDELFPGGCLLWDTCPGGDEGT